MRKKGKKRKEKRKEKRSETVADPATTQRCDCSVFTPVLLTPKLLIVINY